MKLNWTFHSTPKVNRTIRTNVIITYGHLSAEFQDLTETQRKAILNILVAIEKDLPPCE